MSIYKGEINQKLIIKTGMDLTGMTAGTINVLRPDEERDFWDINWKFVSGGDIIYYTKAGDVDVSGVYKVYTIDVIIGSRFPKIFYTEGFYFEVKER